MEPSTVSDEVDRILSEHAAKRAVKPDLDVGVEIDEATFDEAGYLRLNPDVGEAIQRGIFASGHDHYVGYGYREGRSVTGGVIEPRNRLIKTATHPSLPMLTSAPMVGHSIESILVSRGGGLMLVGWVDDASNPVSHIRISTRHWRVVMDGAKLVRIRRGDVENALGRGATHSYGMFGFLFFDKQLTATETCILEIILFGGEILRLELLPRAVDDAELRNVLLTYLAHASFYGNAHVEGIMCLEGGLGDEIVRFNRSITQKVVASPYVERFGSRKRKPVTSLVVCLYGKAEFQFVQSCLYAGLPGIQDYEFIFVSNSPELAETLLREARSASLVYGVDQTIVVLPANAGFGGANNVAVQASSANRIIILNPDVFPRDQAWARLHTDMIDNLPAEQTRMFGVPLYYDDGSLMHGGMYFDVDTGLSMAGGHPKSCAMVRVEHYGKGAPSWSQDFLRPRPVPAVTGAFISADRDWFEALGGFTEDYVFGHYEDADLCLKSLERDVPVWLQDIKMWHLEGKGSTRLPPHEGGSLVNRWLFSKTWLSTIDPQLIGQSPTHPLLSAS